MNTVTFHIPGHTMHEHRLVVPLDHGGKLPAGARDRDGAMLPETIVVFAREFVRDGHENAPRLVYFQGGPGSAANRPAPISGWIDILLNDFRVVLLDERGTGQSTPLDQTMVNEVGDVLTQSDYLSCFRQDSIVADAEALRRELQADEPWSALGQSFGGFCITTYLSMAPQGLRSAMITAGLPSTHRHADDVYRLTWAKTDGRNREFFERYPQDEDMAWRISEHLAETAHQTMETGDPQFCELLPNGEILTPGRFRMLGINLGHSYGLETMHYLLENPFVEVGGKPRLSSRFRTEVAQQISYVGNPMYWALHEAIYQQGSSGATAWSAHRIRDEFEQFELPSLNDGGAGERELRSRGLGFRFSGEHEFPWQGESDPALWGLVDAVNELAIREDLPELHQPDVLAGNDVPVAAWMYEPDMFVPFEISSETADEIRGLKRLVSPTYHHDALRTSAPEIMAGFRSALGDNYLGDK